MHPADKASSRTHSPGAAHLLFAAFQAHYDELLAHVRRKVRSPALAADIVQETYIRLADAELPPHVANPRAYLYLVAGNLATDHLRRERTRARYISDGAPSEHLADAAPGAEQALAAKERVALLLQIVDELPPRCREVFILRKFEDLSHDEIAERLGMTRSMVYKHIRNALLHCAHRLGQED